MNNPRNPYRMKDFYHVDPEYGTDQDLKDFVAAAHALKLRVMLDMVYLHCGPKAVFIASNPDFVKRADDGKVKNAGWSFPGLNFASAELREYLWKNMEWWIRDFDVDGFRCDVADQIPLDFWEEGRARIERIKPDVGMLAEGTRKADQLKAFDLDYGWGGAFAQLQDGAAIRKLWTTMRDQRPRGGAKFARFIDNHDIANDDYNNRLEKRWGTARVDAALVWLFTMDGVPFLYNGQEVADTARHSIFGRAPIDWAAGETEAGRARFAFVKSLCALRGAERALVQGDLTWLDHDQPQAVSAFVRTLDGARVVSVINLTDKPVKVNVKGAEGVWKSLLSKDAANDGACGFELAKHGYFVGKQ
jgi:glycosidase